jgi:hypothetical protein
LTQKIWQYYFSVISKKNLAQKNGKKSQNFGSQKIEKKKKKTLITLLALLLGCHNYFNNNFNNHPI